MKRALAGAVLVTALALAGCASGPDRAERTTDIAAEYVTSRQVTLSDGRTVFCVIFAYGNAGSITCDWNGP